MKPLLCKSQKVKKFDPIFSLGPASARKPLARLGSLVSTPLHISPSMTYHESSHNSNKQQQQSLPLIRVKQNPAINSRLMFQWGAKVMPHNWVCKYMS